MVTITVVGLGFVGLTTALGLAELGYKVFGFDNNERHKQSLKNHEVDFVEPNLTEKLKCHSNKHFFIVDEIEVAISESTCIFICVGSPCHDDGSVDLSQIISAINNCMSYMQHDGRHRTFAIKSTVPPGTCCDVITPIIRKKGFSEEEISIASNPEFLREGFCWEDFMNPGRVIIGATNKKALKLLKEIYLPLNSSIHILTPNEAEFSKYLSNVMLTTMISFSNELAYVAKQFGGINIMRVFETLHDDNRLKNSGISSYIYPGCGYGGYCLPKDIKAFTKAVETRGYKSELLSSVMAINNSVIDRLCDEVVARSSKENTFGILGLSFKPGTNDVRESASEYIIQGLIKRGCESIVAYDPIAMKSFENRYPDLPIQYVDCAKTLLDCSNLVIIATAWKEFENLDYSGKILIDGRYMIKEKSDNGN